MAAALPTGSCNASAAARAISNGAYLPPRACTISRRALPPLSRANARIASLPPVVRAVALESSSEPAVLPQQAQERRPKVYHFLVANAQFMLDEEEHFKEQLYERLRHFGEKNREQDFWLVIEPKFLDSFPELTKRLGRPAVALVSTDGPWIKFMKLRLDRVMEQSIVADSLEEVLASNPTELRFENTATWTAPYPKYEFGWWDAFLPQKP